MSENEHIVYEETANVLKEHRFVKELAREENIILTGQKGKVLENILENAEGILSEVQDQNEDWVNKKKQLLDSYLTPINPLQVEKSYHFGLQMTIMQEYRTYKKISNSEIDKLMDPEYMRGLISSYSFDFIRSLRISERMGLRPQTALELAQTSSRYNPTRFLQLVKQNPDINLGVIIRAATGSPVNPEGFLETFRATVGRLQSDPMYMGLGRTAIVHAATYYTSNPEGYLDDYKASVERLSNDPEFSHLGKAVITFVAIGHPKHPEIFLTNFKAAMLRLGAQEKYRQVSVAIRQHAALHEVSNPERFLDNYIAAESRLCDSEKYKGIRRSVIRFAILHATKDPDRFLDNFMIKLDKLSKDNRYNFVGNAILIIAASNYARDPEGFLKKFTADVARLSQSEKYKGFPGYVLRHAAVHSPVDPEGFLDGLEGVIKEYTVYAEGKGVPDYVILRAALRSSMDMIDEYGGRASQQVGDKREISEEEADEELLESVVEANEDEE